MCCFGVTCCVAGAERPCKDRLVNPWRGAPLRDHPGGEQIGGLTDPLQRDAAHIVMGQASGEGVSCSNRVGDLHVEAPMFDGFGWRDEKTSSGTTGHANELEPVKNRTRNSRIGGLAGFFGGIPWRLPV